MNDHIVLEKCSDVNNTKRVNSSDDYESDCNVKRVKTNILVQNVHVVKPSDYNLPTYVQHGALYNTMEKLK